MYCQQIFPLIFPSSIQSTFSKHSSNPSLLSVIFNASEAVQTVRVPIQQIPRVAGLISNMKFLYRRLLKQLGTYNTFKQKFPSPNILILKLNTISLINITNALSKCILNKQLCATENKGKGPLNCNDNGIH